MGENMRCCVGKPPKDEYGDITDIRGKADLENSGSISSMTTSLENK